MQAEVHLAEVIEVDPQQDFLPAGELARYVAELLGGGSIKRPTLQSQLGPDPGVFFARGRDLMIRGAADRKGTSMK